MPTSSRLLLPWLPALGAALTILAGALPASLAYVFKPLTTPLIIGFAWPRGAAQSRQRPDASPARYAAIGGVLFMGSDGLLAIDKFAFALPLAPLWILASYWLAQSCIARSLAAAARSTSP